MKLLKEFLKAVAVAWLALIAVAAIVVMLYNFVPQPDRGPYREIPL